MPITTTQKKTRGEYEKYLSGLYPTYNEEVMEYLLTHSQKPNKMKAALNRGSYGRILRTYDPIAFNVGYGEWAGEY